MKPPYTFHPDLTPEQLRNHADQLDRQTRRFRELAGNNDAFAAALRREARKREENR